MCNISVYTNYIIIMRIFEISVRLACNSAYIDPKQTFVKSKHCMGWLIPYWVFWLWWHLSSYTEFTFLPKSLSGWYVKNTRTAVIRESIVNRRQNSLLISFEKQIHSFYVIYMMMVSSPLTPLRLQDIRMTQTDPKRSIKIQIIIWKYTY